MPIRATALDHLVINVVDVEVSAAWYVRVLGVTREDFDPGDGKATRTAITFGSQKINLRPLAMPTEEWLTGARPRAGGDDLCFLTETSPVGVAGHLRDLGVAIELGPVVKQGARGPIDSVYCRDPDGNLVEIASYPG